MIKMHTLRRLITPRIQLVAVITAAIIVAGPGSGWPTLQAQPTTNPIVLENQNPGSPQSEWDIAGSGDASIQGYATDISVNKGGTVTFKIKLQPAVVGGYVIDIYRLGYYQGLGARHIGFVTPTSAQVDTSPNQPARLARPAGAGGRGQVGLRGHVQHEGPAVGDLHCQAPAPR